MAKGLNKVQIIGNLGRDPETRYMNSGSAVCNFTVAVSEEWKDRNSGERKEKTDWHRIVAFRKLAEICGEYLTKGRQVYIEGRLQTRSWEQEGVTKYMTEVVANDMQMLGGKGGGGNQGGGSQGGQAYESGGGSGGYGPDGAFSTPPDDFDDDIPF